MIRISGIVSDFENKPIANVEVEIKGADFRPLYRTKSDNNGRYELSVRRGTYLALMAYKDYGIKNLEYWVRNQSYGV